MNNYVPEESFAVLTDEAPGPLLDNLDTEGARSVALVTVALHGYVPLLLEGPVHAAVVLEPVLAVGVLIGRHITSYSYTRPDHTIP